MVDRTQSSTSLDADALGRRELRIIYCKGFKKRKTFCYLWEAWRTLSSYCMCDIINEFLTWQCWMSSAKECTTDSGPSLTPKSLSPSKASGAAWINMQQEVMLFYHMVIIIWHLLDTWNQFLTNYAIYH